MCIAVVRNKKERREGKSKGKGLEREIETEEL